MNDVNNTISNVLASNHLLVDLTLRRWTGRKTDTKASNEVTASHQATNNSAKVVKDLMAGARGELKAVASAQDNLRSFVYSNTLPWSANTNGRMSGSRLLNAARSIEFLSKFKEYHAAYERALDDFLDVYELRRQQALINLGSLGSHSDYPATDEIKQSFDISLEMTPCPALTDYSRLAIPVEVAEALGTRLARQQQTQIENAMHDLRSRLLEELTRMASQFGKVADGSEKVRLHGSLLTNMQRLVSLLRDSNFTDDVEVSDLADRLDALASQDLKVIKNNPTVAKQAALKAQDIMNDIDDVFF